MMARQVANQIGKIFLCVLFCGLSGAAAWASGAVYAMTNQLHNNQVIVYQRAGNGTLTLVQTVNTGGGGGGAQLAPPVDSLGSQGGLVLDGEHHLLFAVNTESTAANTQDCQVGTITSFVVAPSGLLTVADRVSSGGLYPDSLAVDRRGDQRLLYVLNAGGPGAQNACGVSPNVTGFVVDRDGQMTPIDGAVERVDPGTVEGTGYGVDCNPGGFPSPAFDCGRNPPAFPRSPAQIGFTPDGSQLIVTVKGTNAILAFPLDPRTGRALAPRVTQAPETPVAQNQGPALPTFFGFAFKDERTVLVTEAFGKSPTIPQPGAGATSSFRLGEDGTLDQISADVGDAGTAACWIVLDPFGGRFAYVANNLSNTVSLYSVSDKGALTLLNATAATASGPNDMGVAGDAGNAFLYVLASGAGEVLPFLIDRRTGALTALSPVGGLPVGNAAQGLAAY
jgi:6-phosphogluconolactonase (cycloisomerase 2 family)